MAAPPRPIPANTFIHVANTDATPPIPSEHEDLHPTAAAGNPSMSLPPHPELPLSASIPPAPLTSDEHSHSEAQPPRERSRSRSRSRSSSVASTEPEDDDDEPETSEWRHIPEDKSAPCEDELKYIESRPEYSALDHNHWQEEAFFKLHDPSISAAAEGRIDWTIEHFNGSKEEPNKENIMHSPVVNVGGYDWKIKFFPKGNSSDFLSLYIENVSMQSAEFEEHQEFDEPALPFLEGAEPIKKRRSVAAQVAVVMYNPTEPRVHDFKADATRFSKQSADYGWRYFAHRDDFYLRRHGQRQALLRDDKLAFSAYIRIIDEPTGCLWGPEDSASFDDTVHATSLRPFSGQLPTIALAPLMHFAPFRESVKMLPEHDRYKTIQTYLWKMLSRTSSHSYGRHMSALDNSDGATVLKRVADRLRLDPAYAHIAQTLIGDLDPEKGSPVHKNRLRSKMCSSVQEAVDKHDTPIATPALLTMELERHEFNRDRRRMQKLKNNVQAQDKITVSGVSYHLFAFMTHCGPLGSNRHNAYVKQNNLWYQYEDGVVTSMTRKQALECSEGAPIAKDATIDERRDSPIDSPSEDDDDEREVMYLVQYVREDYAWALSSLKYEAWDSPPWITRKQAARKTTDDQETTTETVAGATEAATEPSASEDHHAPATNAPQMSTPNEALMGEGVATPERLDTDGEGDVIMSDADDSAPDGEVADMASSTSLNTLVAVPDTSNTPKQVTIDCIGQDYYSGDMLHNKYHGQGHLIAMNGDEYRGAFLEGKPSGTGTMTSASTNNVYEGEWLEGVHHGHGKYTVASTGTVYEGGWKHGQKHGQFTTRGSITEDDRAYCTICFANELNTAFNDCGHVVACRQCASKIDYCPLCRKRVVGRLQLYGIKMTLE